MSSGPSDPGKILPDITEDAVLGGRLRLRQPRKGHRVGHDAILLAAATQAHGGEHAADLGAGVGGAGLALAMRVPRLRVSLVEIDPVLSRLSAENAHANGLADRVAALALDVGDFGQCDAAGLTAGCADRVLMNPPFHDAARRNLSPDPARRLAYAATSETLPIWIAAARRLLKPAGTLTMIWRADELPAVRNALAERFGAIAIMPVHPKPDAAPIRVLVRARIPAGPEAIRPPLYLNESNGRPSAAAEAVLREARMLDLEEN